MRPDQTAGAAATLYLLPNRRLLQFIGNICYFAVVFNNTNGKRKNWDVFGACLRRSHSPLRCLSLFIFVGSPVAAAVCKRIRSRPRLRCNDFVLLAPLLETSLYDIVVFMSFIPVTDGDIE